MNLEEAKQKKEELEKEIKELSNFIKNEEKRNKLHFLEEGKYYCYKDSQCVTTYFQYAGNCEFKESEICGPTLSVSRYITEELTMMYHTYSFGNHGVIFIGEFGCFKEIDKETYDNVFKRAIGRCEGEIKE